MEIFLAVETKGKQVPEIHVFWFVGFLGVWFFFVLSCFFVCLFVFRSIPTAYGSSQARG